MIYPVPKPTRRPPKARKPLKQYRRINAKRATQRRGPPRSEAYKAKVRKLPCCVGGRLSPCWWPYGVPVGTIEASHTEGGDRGGGMKSSDFRCVPKCTGHHREWEKREGFCFGWNRQQRREWSDARVAETQAAIKWRTKEAA